MGEELEDYQNYAIKLNEEHAIKALRDLGVSMPEKVPPVKSSPESMERLKDTIIEQLQRAHKATVDDLQSQLASARTHAEVMEYKASKCNELLRGKEKELSAAREVIAFYADQKNWNGLGHQHHEMMIEADHYETGESFIYTSDEDFETEIPFKITSGGKKAQDFVKQFGGK